MRKFLALVAAATLSTTASFADVTQTDSTPAQSSAPAQPLAPGSAAGVHKAQLWAAPAGLWIAAGVIAVGVGAAVVLSNHSSSSTPSTTGK